MHTDVTQQLFYDQQKEKRSKISLSRVTEAKGRHMTQSVLGKEHSMLWKIHCKRAGLEAENYLKGSHPEVVLFHLNK